MEHQKYCTQGRFFCKQKDRVHSDRIGNGICHRSRKIKSITIPATVRYKGKTYKVTSIGSKAFYKCSKLKSIAIKSKNLKSVGRNAFKGISKNAKVTVPKSKYNAYRKLFKKAGFGSKVTWKKG